jgi:hypothetical protein
MDVRTKKDADSNGLVLDLGKYGKVEDVPAEGHWPETPKFPWYGVEVRVHPTLSDTALVDLMEESGEYEDDSPEAAIAVKRFIRDVIHPDDFDDFWKLGKAHGLQTLQFAEVAARIIEAVTGDPTKESHDSSNGQLPTATKSQDGSSKLTRTIAELENEGRADLAEFYLLAAEAGVSH